MAFSDPINLFMQVSSMKSFFLKLLLFLIGLFLIDMLIGYACDTLMANAKGGNTYRNNVIWNDVSSDILIFGSSRAVHHYDPGILTDSLGGSCFNCGQDGNGIIYNYARYQYIRRKKSPKIVIYDVTPAFDLLLGPDNHRYLGGLKPYYDYSGVSDVFCTVDKTEKIKMQCKSYKYNSIYLQFLTDNLFPKDEIGNNGFIPIEKELDTLKIGEQDVYLHFDKQKILFLNKFVEESVDTKVIFVVSPTWYGMKQEYFTPIKDLCKENGLLFIDYSNDTKYLHNNDYFSDGQHLNRKGAEKFSKELAHYININR